MSGSTRHVTLALLLLAYGSGAADQPATDPQTQLYFLHREKGNSWCIYSSEAVWRARVPISFSDIVGFAAYSNGQVASVNFREMDRTGDWAVENTYSFGSTGDMTGLQRRITYLSEREQKHETYVIRGDEAILVSASAVDLDDGKPLSLPLPIESVGAPWPLETNIKKLPMYKILRDGVQPLPTGEYCHSQ